MLNEVPPLLVCRAAGSSAGTILQTCLHIQARSCTGHSPCPALPLTSTCRHHSVPPGCTASSTAVIRCRRYWPPDFARTMAPTNGLTCSAPCFARSSAH